MSFFSADELQSLSGSAVRVDFLCAFEFKSSTVRVWNGNTDLVAGGHTWKPMYGFGSIDGLGVSGGTTSESVTFGLNGLPDQDTNLLALALTETPEVTQQVVSVFLQLFDEDWQTFGSPIRIFTGFMQPPKVGRGTMALDSGAVQSITLVAENAMFNRSKPPLGRYTDRDQQGRSTGDKFFQFTPTLLFKTLVWPDY